MDDGVSVGLLVLGLLKKNGFLPEDVDEADPGFSCVGVRSKGMTILSAKLLLNPPIPAPIGDVCPEWIGEPDRPGVVTRLALNC